MTDPSLAIRLHHRWALGEELTPEEQQMLDAWYSEQDAKEAASLQINENQDEVTQALKKQIAVMLRQVSETVNRIQQVTAENETLRRENEQLKRLLAQQLRQQRA